jgi:hypothetical protein
VVTDVRMDNGAILRHVKLRFTDQLHRRGLTRLAEDGSAEEGEGVSMNDVLGLGADGITTSIAQADCEWHPVHSERMAPPGTFVAHIGFGELG